MTDEPRRPDPDPMERRRLFRSPISINVENLKRRTEPDRRKTSLGVRVRYGIAIAASVIAAYLAGNALSSARTSAQQAHFAAHQTRALQREQQAEATLGHENAALSASLQTLVSRVQSDERQTCRIQQRGLAQQQPLIGVLSAAYDLSKLPQTRAQRRAARRMPASERRAVRQLERDLRAYVRIGRQQPKNRTCS